jgi:small subunit ribosomal protein S21
MVDMKGRQTRTLEGRSSPRWEGAGSYRRFHRPGAGRARDGEFKIVQIVVRDNNVDQALKALKKKMQREGLFREMKRRNHFEKPSERKAREKAEAVRRARKLARKRAQREGLLPKT